jgi:hypothetical protein
LGELAVGALETPPSPKWGPAFRYRRMAVGLPLVSGLRFAFVLEWSFARSPQVSNLILRQPLSETVRLDDTDLPADPDAPDSRGIRLQSSSGTILSVLRGYLTILEHRSLRIIVLVGLVVRLVLAPLTSWASDTPRFILSTVSLLYLGNPYATSLWFNLPLPTFVAAPFLAVPTLLYGPQGLVTVVSAIAPLTIQTGVDASEVPTPGALLAWKLPLILCDVLVGLLLYQLTRRFRDSSGLRPNWVAAAWLLNPLVIWATAVHGEVDTLAALFVLLAAVSLMGERWAPAGLFLGLGVFSKAYPVALIPLALAVILARPGARGLIRRLTETGWLSVGLGVSAVPFLPYLPQMLGVLGNRWSIQTYGGVSVLAVFNGASPKLGGWYGQLTSNLAVAAALLDGLRALALGGILLGALFVVWRMRGTPTTEGERFRWILLAILWAIVGVLLSYSVPQPENLLGVIPPALLLACLTRWTLGVRCLLALSGAGVLLYASLLTPAAVFYPLARLLGPPAVLWVNGVVLAYIHAAPLQGSLWLTAGLLGGGVLLGLWVASGILLMPEELRMRMRKLVKRDSSSNPSSPPSNRDRGSDPDMPATLGHVLQQWPATPAPPRCLGIRAGQAR